MLNHRRWQHRRSGKGERLAFIHPEGCENRPAYKRVFETLTEKAEARGYGVDCFPLSEKTSNSTRSLERILHARGIRGILLLEGATPVLGQFAHPEKFVIVECGAFQRSRFQRHGVIADVIMAGESLRAMLDERPHYRRIGMATFTDAGFYADLQRECVLGMLQARFSNRLVPVPQLTCDHRQPQRVIQWVREQKPDLLIGVNDAFYWDLLEAGFTLPQDLAFVALRLNPPDAHISGFVPPRKSCNAPWKLSSNCSFTRPSANPSPARSSASNVNGAPVKPSHLLEK